MRDEAASSAWCYLSALLHPPRGPCSFSQMSAPSPSLFHLLPALGSFAFLPGGKRDCRVPLQGSALSRDCFVMSSARRPTKIKQPLWNHCNKSLLSELSHEGRSWDSAKSMLQAQPLFWEQDPSLYLMIGVAFAFHCSGWFC